MKVRKDFVTNSSSSSFIISKRCLDVDQIEAIRKHRELGEKLGLDYCNWAWDISEDEDYITGYTPMDNFDMDTFLRKIDVSDKNINWGAYPFDLPEEDDDENIYLDWRKLLHEN